MGTLLSEILPDILQYTVSIITISIALIKMNWLIFAGIIVTFPVVIFSSEIIAKRINELAKKRRGKYDELADIALDNIEGIEVAKAYGIEEVLGRRVTLKADAINGLKSKKTVIMIAHRQTTICMAYVIKTVI